MSKPPKHPKHRGEWAELRFMAAAADHGLHVAKPYGDSRPYDTLVEYNGRIWRVQVKATSRRIHGGFQCVMSSVRPAYTRREIDFFAIYVIPHDAWYIIPVEKVSRSSVFFRGNHRKGKFAPYREAWHLLRG